MTRPSDLEVPVFSALIPNDPILIALEPAAVLVAPAEVSIAPDLNLIPLRFAAVSLENALPNATRMIMSSGAMHYGGSH